MVGCLVDCFFLLLHRYVHLSNVMLPLCVRVCACFCAALCVSLCVKVHISKVIVGYISEREKKAADCHSAAVSSDSSFGVRILFLLSLNWIISIFFDYGNRSVYFPFVVSWINAACGGIRSDYVCECLVDYVTALESVLFFHSNVNATLMVVRANAFGIVSRVTSFYR